MGSPDQGVTRLGFRLTRPFQKANLLQGIGGSSDVVLSGVAFGTGKIPRNQWVIIDRLLPCLARLRSSEMKCKQRLKYWPNVSRRSGIL